MKGRLDMKNYKILPKNMKAILGNGMPYRMNVTYEVSGEIIPCKNGFHYCKKIKDLFKYYRTENIRIFECEVDKEVTKDGIKYCTNKIRLTRELPKEEIDKYFIDNLDELKNDKNLYVRAAVAQQGYALEELKNDESWGVRLAVAEQGYALDELKNDEDYDVRVVVAQQGYALDELKNDKHWKVREAVAQQGYALDELKNDKRWKVRLAVAEQGYALDELKNDKDWKVREEALRQINIRNSLF